MSTGTNVAFVPVGRHDLPALVARKEGDTYVFECVTVYGEVQVSTQHVSFSDTLRQIALRMEQTPGVDYETFDSL